MKKIKVNKVLAVNIVFVSAFVVSMSVVGYLIIKGKASTGDPNENTFKLFTPAWRNIGNQNVADIARDYDYVFGHLDPREFHSVNPDTKMVKYNLGPYVTKAYVPGLGNNPLPSEALAKDANGNYIKANNFENWLGVPDNPRWLDYVRNIVNQQFAQMGGDFDGIFIDSMGTAPVTSNYLNAKPINPNTGKQYTATEWMSAEKVMMQAIVDHVGPNKLVIYNGLGSGSRYWDSQNESPRLLLTVPGVDGAMSEIIWRSPESSGTTFPNYNAWKQDLDMVIDMQNRGIPGFWWTKCWSGGDTCQDDANATAIMTQWRRYAMGSYLLGAGDKSYFNFDTKKSDDNAAEPSADYKLDIGSPTEQQSVVGQTTSGSIHKRAFSKGLVYVNPTSQAFTANLPSGNFKNLDGQTITSSVDLPAHTSAILVGATTTPSAPSIKPALQGVVWSKSIGNGGPDITPTNPKLPPQEYRDAGVDAFVASVTWDRLQPDNALAMNQEITDTNPADDTAGNPIDSAIKYARQYGLKIKLRIFTGSKVPRWVKSLDYNCADSVPTESCGLHLVETPSDGAFSHDEYIGKFWSDSYKQAYDQLQQKLAEKYDNTPEIIQVTISRCMTMYPEPFIRQFQYSGNKEAYDGAGYSYDNDAKCQREEIDSHRYWAKTRSGLALNPFSGYKVPVGSANGATYTAQVMDYCRATLGERCVLENYSIRDSTTTASPLPASYLTTYNDMKTKGPLTSYQTAVPQRIGDWRATLNWAVDQGANHVELLDDENNINKLIAKYPVAEIAQFDLRLSSNSTGGILLPKEGDLNDDGKVDILDVSTLMSKWNTNDAKADIKKDGKVDVFDLSLLLSKMDGR